MKALLLAAGYGTRLKPLTDHVPKPLTLFMGRPILDLIYQKVIATGIEAIAVNTHHLAASIEQHIQASPVYRLPVHLSFEREILGTGGSINPLRPWLAGDDLLIFNGDILASLDLKAFVKAFATSEAMAAMVLIPYKAGTTPVYLQDGHVVGIGEAVAGAVPRTFAGIHILGKGFIEALPQQGFLNVIDTYKTLLNNHQVLAFEHDGYWADLGIPRDYFEAHQELWLSAERDALVQALFLDTRSWNFDEGQSTVFVDCQPIRGFKHSFVFGPIHAEAAIQIDNCIVYPNSRLPKHRQERGKILTPYASLNIVDDT